MGTEHIKEKLLQSIHLYENILNDMQRLEIEIGTATPATLMNFNAALRDQQNTAARIEHDLSIQLSSSETDGEVGLLIEMREKLMKDIMFLNQRIAAKASGIKSFVSHEIKRLQSGLSAMKGYKQTQYNQGRIVNSTS